MIVRQFLDWVETAPPDRRAEAAHALARAFLHADVDEETRSGLEAAMTLLLDDSAPEVRFALADALGASPDAPRHVIVSLANDQLPIAAHVLARSPVLVDAELVDVVATAEEALQVAVASRPALSSAVVGALAEVGARAACRALFENVRAGFTGSTLRRIAVRFGDDPDMRDALLGRADLPADVHQYLVRQLGNALCGAMVQKGWVAPERAAKVTREACDRATLVIAGDTARAAMPALVEHIRATGQLTTELLLRAVCSGQIPFFEAALVALTETPAERVAALVATGRTAAFRAIYVRAGLPESAFEAFVAALDAWRKTEDGEQRDRYATAMQVINAVTSRYARRNGSDMTEMAAMMRRFAADQARDAARDFARRSDRHAHPVHARPRHRAGEGARTAAA